MQPLKVLLFQVKATSVNLRRTSLSISYGVFRGSLRTPSFSRRRYPFLPRRRKESSFLALYLITNESNLMKLSYTKDLKVL